MQMKTRCSKIYSFNYKIANLKLDRQTSGIKNLQRLKAASDLIIRNNFLQQEQDLQDSIRLSKPKTVRYTISQTYQETFHNRFTS
jgi:hypothetical protein